MSASALQPAVAQPHTLSAPAVPAPDLTLRTELRRKLMHMLPGVLPFIFASIPHRDPISPTARGIVIASCVALTLLVLVNRRRIARAGETGWAARVLCYPATVLAAVFLFPANAEFAAVVVVVLAFGDGAASLGGMGLSSARLPWNPQKTRAGLVCFLLCATPMAILAYWREAQPVVSFAQAAACGTAAALAGAVAESLPGRVNDNLRVGLAAGAAVAFTHLMVAGAS